MIRAMHLFLIATLLFANDAVGTSRFEKARHAYYKAIAGDQNFYQQALASFKQMHQQDNSDPAINVYYGSLCLFEAAHTWALWRKNSLSREGLQLMDGAVAVAPDDLEIRFVRAATTFHLPSFFHRKEQSKQDFAILAGRAPTAVQEGRLEPRLAAASLYFSGVFLDSSGRHKKAVEQWQAAIAIAPDSAAAKDAAEKLKQRVSE